VNTKHVVRYTALIGVAVLFLLALTSAVFAAPAAAVRYVVPGGATSGACASWATACDLPYALSSATSGDELWVKAGTYKPTTGSDRTATFPLNSGVGVYGGFAGTETLRDQRNWTANITILSGDIGVNGNTSDNVYHVVTGSSTNNTALLDGFTVTGGNANGSNPDDQGGGMYNSYGNPVVRNVIFNNNTATTAGGGMYNVHSSPAVQSVIFSNNASTTGNGGALVNSNSSPTLVNVTFNANSVTGGNGGALLNDFSSPSLVNVTFSNNTATGGNGGALYNDLESVPLLTNVTFSSNSAIMDSGYNGGHGGALYNYATNTPPGLINVTFNGNQAIGYDAIHPAYGGAMYIIAGSVAITNAILWGNTPDQLYNDSADIVSLNTSIVQGGCPTGSTCTNVVATNPLLGALGNYGGSVQTMPLLPNSPALDTALDSACPATDARGISRPIGPHCDIGAFESSRFTLAITGGNNQSALINTGFAQPLRVSVMANNASEPVNGGQVMFTPPTSGASANLVTSPAAITNSVASVSATANGVRGAYAVSATMAGANAVGFNLRNLSPMILYVKPGTSGNCNTWVTACELQTALGQAFYGDEIWVAAGTYKPTTGNDRNATFALPNGVGVYGGFAGTETARNQRNWTTNVTTLNGDIGTIGNNSDNVYHVVSANATDNATALDGFTVTGGQGTGQTGGGVYINNGSLSIANCRIANNFADYGGGVFQSGDSGRVAMINSRIELNTTLNHGGGLYVSGKVALTNTQIVSNTAGGHGGGVHANLGHAEVTGGLIAGNQAGLNGGGLNANNSVNISGTHFISNTAAQDGGGLLQWNAGYTVTVTNARFERNRAGQNGGGVCVSKSATTTIVNTQVFSNTVQDFYGGGIYLGSGKNARLSGNRIEGNTAFGGGGIYANFSDHAALSDNQFYGNRTRGYGGGLYLINSMNITLTHNQIVSNTADYGGGGISLSSATDAALIGNQIMSNTAAEAGGGIYVNISTRPILTGNRLLNNTADKGGGLALRHTHDAAVVNTVIADNKALLGGGVHVEAYSIRFLHTTLARNTSTGYGDGSGVAVVDGGSTTHTTVAMTNTILVNQTVGITVTAGNTATLNSVLWSGNTVNAGGAGSVNVQNATTGDPAFATDGYHLTRGSLAIDHGIAAGVTIDMDGDLRPMGSGYDLGADEFRFKVYLPLILK
jgi:parallel beta-helix repeat protein